MFVTKHPNRYLLNLSHPEMAALRRVVNAGMLLLESEDEEGLWKDLDDSERKAIRRWMKGDDPLEPTGPRQVRKRLSPVA